MYSEAIVGFDAREMWLDVESQWTQDQKDLWQNKDELLLRVDALKPLSVDHYVWHSVFSEEVEPRLWRTVARRPEYTGPNWDSVFSENRRVTAPSTWRYRGMWRNLANLKNYLQQSWGNVWKPCYLVAVVELVDEADDEIDLESENRGLESISPDAVDDEWELLGYDVADYDLISGLCNGVVDSDEMAKLRHDWKHHLNEHHLFTEPQRAYQYIRVANTRYPSHTPYYVYALYGIEKVW